MRPMASALRTRLWSTYFKIARYLPAVTCLIEHWATRQLLKAVTPYCSSENLDRLEGRLLEYYTDFEIDASGRHPQRL